MTDGWISYNNKESGFPYGTGGRGRRGGRQEGVMVDIAVVGAGTMGAGIAESAALAGMSVAMLDVGEEALGRGRRTIERDLERRVKKGRLSEEERRNVLGRVATTTSVGDCSGAPLVVEAVVEDVEVKRKVFAELEGVVGGEAVLATNTSSLSVAGIAAATGSTERVVGMHFFNPVPAMRLVEVVAGPSTDDSALRRAEEVSERLGKMPVRVADTPGFIVNRVAKPFYYQPRFRPSYLQRAMVEAGTLGRKTGRGFYDYDGEQGAEDSGPAKSSQDVALRVISCIVNEAFLTLQEGVATAEDIDRAMKLGANYPKGPFEWAEEIGAGRILDTLDSLREIHGDAYLAAPSLRHHVGSGE